jgi:WD40 repeat protein
VFVTCGDDGAISKWRKQKVDWKVSSESKPFSADFHPNGIVVVVGTADGHVLVLNSETGSNVKTIFVGKFRIAKLAFDPIGDSLAIVAETGILFVYSATNGGKNYRKSGRVNCRSKNMLTHVDWSLDSQFIQVCSSSSDFAFVDVQRRKTIDERLVNKVVWNKQTCPIGDSVFGTLRNIHFTKNSDFVTSLNVSKNMNMLVTGNGRGSLKVFEFPTSSIDSPFFETRVVRAAISEVKIYFEDSYVLLVGEENETVFRFKICIEPTI